MRAFVLILKGNFVLLFVALFVADGLGDTSKRDSPFLSASNHGPKRVTTELAVPEPSDVLSIVRSILDEKASNHKRDQAIRDNPGLAADLIMAMVSNVKVGTEQESRLIPWLWKVAVQAGKNNDKEELARVLEVSLPNQDEKLQCWQAIVIGGGIINGLSSKHENPRARIQEIIADDSLLIERWQQSLVLVERMIEDDSLSPGTRCDAIRMAGMNQWKDIHTLFDTLIKKTDEPELQMGTITALLDMQNKDAVLMVLKHLDTFAAKNCELAIDLLLRKNKQTTLLLDAIEMKDVDLQLLNIKQIDAVCSHKIKQIRERAIRICVPSTTSTKVAH